jgi:ABC-type nickel/cobalt efflux system permease component RcnA
MGFLLFIIILFVIFVGGGWYIGRSIGGFLGQNLDKEDKPTYIDNSVHHHHHNHVHTHQNLTIIDEKTHQKGLDYFSDQKESRDE